MTFVCPSSRRTGSGAVPPGLSGNSQTRICPRLFPAATRPSLPLVTIGCHVGLRTTGGQVLGEQQFGSLGSYTKLTMSVNTGANTSVVIYSGLWANGDTWLQVDDVAAS